MYVARNGNAQQLIVANQKIVDNLLHIRDTSQGKRVCQHCHHNDNVYCNVLDCMHAHAPVRVRIDSV